MIYIPAKTFLLGEYLALQGGPAILLATNPCFSIELIKERKLVNIHANSPAGLFWQHSTANVGFIFHDPYQEIGGLGASSAQFVGAVKAYCRYENQPFDEEYLLNRYYQFAWTKQGIRPSGYDVIAQTRGACVYINRSKKQTIEYNWNFPDLALFLVHTGKKIATHQHLNCLSTLNLGNKVTTIVDNARTAFEQTNSQQLVDSINDYFQQLKELNLVALHTNELINQIKKEPFFLAAKGCGALGADIILLIAENSSATQAKCFLKERGLHLMATQVNINDFTKKN